MKQTFTLFFFLLFSLGYGQKSALPALNGRWLVNLGHPDIGSARTIMWFEADSTSFSAHTRKDADKALLGNRTAFLARTFTKTFKEGSLLHIVNGSCRRSKDTLLVAGIFTSALGNYYFRGYVLNNILFARLLNGRNEQRGTLTGTRDIPALPLENYPALFDKAVSLTREKVYNRNLLQTATWKNFDNNMKRVLPRVEDDLEMVFAFFYYARKLPVSHYAVMKMPEKEEADTAPYEPQVFLEEKKPGTAYLKITSFGGTAAEMDSIFSLIRQRNYSNLIVDLRGNPGGSVEAGMVFAAQTADTVFYGGIFLTQLWFNTHNQPPAVAEYPSFQPFSAANFDLIISGVHSTPGLCLKVIPAPETYSGRLFILTDGGTASTCEPLVYGLKQRKRAVVVGETTAGAMLNGEIFPLDKGFSLVIPTADYYAADGYRIDQQGVKPDIRVKSGAALDYVQNKLIK